MKRANSACRYTKQLNRKENPLHQQLQNTFNYPSSPIGGFGHFVNKTKSRIYRKQSIFNSKNISKGKSQIVRSLRLIKSKPKIYGRLAQVNNYQSQQEKIYKHDKKINMLKEIMFPNRIKDNDNDSVNVHFTQYVMSEKKPDPTCILHSRSRRSVTATKNTKIKEFQSEKISARKGMSSDKFKSIEIAKQSKYVSIKKIGMGEITSNKSINQLKRKLESSLKNQRTEEKGIKNQRKEGFRLEQCKPWETTRQYLMEDDHYLM